MDQLYHIFFVSTKLLRTQQDIDDYYKYVILKDMRKRRDELTKQYKEFEQKEADAGKKLQKMQKKITGERKHFGMRITKSDVLACASKVLLYRKKKDEMHSMVVNFDSLVANAEIAFASMGIMNTISKATDSTLMKMSDPKVQETYSTLMTKCTKAMDDSSNLLKDATFDPSNTQLAEEATNEILKEVGLSDLDTLLELENRLNNLDNLSLPSAVKTIPVIR